MDADDVIEFLPLSVFLLPATLDALQVASVDCAVSVEIDNIRR